MVKRLSALADYYKLGQSGLLAPNESDVGIQLCNVQDLTLFQVAAWPQSLTVVGDKLAETIGCKQAPEPCRACVVGETAILRVEPLAWWLYGIQAPGIDVELGTFLDISHSRTQLTISGPDAPALLNRHLSLDLRESSFPVGTVASSVMHHVGVTLWRSDKGYELFIPRGYAVSLWKGLIDSATQFGMEVVESR